MGHIGFSVTYKDEEKVKAAIRQINKKRIPVKKLKVFIRDSKSDESFLKAINPSLLKVAFKSAIIGGVVGVSIFFIIWGVVDNFIEGVSTFRMALLTLVTGSSVGIFLGLALSVISKESEVQISIKDLENEAVVLDFQVDGNLREVVEKILQKTGADHIFED